VSGGAVCCVLCDVCCVLWLILCGVLTLSSFPSLTSGRTDIAKRLRYTKDIMYRLINIAK